MYCTLSVGNFTQTFLFFLQNLLLPTKVTTVLQNILQRLHILLNDKNLYSSYILTMLYPYIYILNFQ